MGMKEILTIDLLYVNHLKLSLIEYLLLKKIYYLEKDLQYGLFNKLFDANIHVYEELVEKGYLTKYVIDSTYKLTPKALSLFSVSNDKFEEFYNLFPSKVPDGFGSFRPTSTESVETKSAQHTKEIWDKLLKSNPEISESIIKGLKNELAHKSRTGSLMYLPNIDSWLNKHSWEQWEDVNNTNTSTKSNIKKI